MTQIDKGTLIDIQERLISQYQMLEDCMAENERQELLILIGQVAVISAD